MRHAVLSSAMALGMGMAAAALLLPDAGVAQAGAARPVMVGGEAQLDACSSVGVPRGLNPRGDNFLAVRAGPSTTAPILFRLRPGHQFFLCDAAAGNSWTGIVFAAAPNSRINCGVGTPIARRRAYRGPCRAGWVSTRFVEVIAG